MKKLRQIIKNSMLYISAVLLISNYPFVSFVKAEESQEPIVIQTTDPAPSSESVTPVSEEAPEPELTYTYNVETGRWDSNKWQYNPATGVYELVPQAVAPTVTNNQEASPTNNDVSDTTDSSLEATSNTTATIDNILDSNAQTGNADVLRNTLAGNATTGNAAAVATLLNTVNTSMNIGDNQKAATFVTDVIGDVNGDIMLYPMLLKAMLEAPTNTTKNIQSTTSTELTNDINLAATSGDATVQSNTTAGNATTGTADTVANVVNIVNSMVSANQSFIGTINIYGSLNGDILIAPDFIPQLLASNSQTSQFADAKNTTIIDTDNTSSIINNVRLAAESGKAAVMNNTSAGDATSGDADTNIVIFNMTGRDIIASNSLLVFVNVLGKWVGVIVDAPTGATAAAIGNGVTSDGIISEPDLVINSNNTSLITNNLNLASRSGNANVLGNTLAGNARTGNASASANIVNISRSQFAVSDWFGILFINVFGSWNGSFGVNTTSGNPIGSPGQGGTGSPQNQSQPQQVIAFIPRSTVVRPPSTITIVATSNTSDTATVTTIAPEVLGATTVSKIPVDAGQAGKFDMRILGVAGVLVAGLIALVIRRFLIG